MVPTQKNSEAGFSLVSILVIMGVVLASILMISQAKFQQQGTQKALRIKQSYTDVNQSLINDVVSQFHDKLKAGGGACSSPTTITKDKGDGIAYKFTNSIADFNKSAPAVHVSAKGRCGNPKTPSGSGNRYYFCVQLTRDPAAPKDSIMNAKVAFAEFAIELIDLQTQKEISCQQYRDKTNDPRDGSAGMAVTMALYWENEVGSQSKTNFSQKALSYIANQN